VLHASRGRAGAGAVGVVGVLVAVVAAALLSSAGPASADPTPSPSPSATAPASADTDKADPTKTDPAKPDPTKTDPATSDAARAAQLAADQAAAAMDAHDTAELIAATQALLEAQADLARARSDLLTARAELAAAQAADAAAQIDLETTAMAEQRAVRDLAAVQARVILHEDVLGRLASAAYRSSGILGEWALVLGSDTPNQLADRLATLQSVGSAGNSIIAQLDADRADLTYSLAHLTATREALEIAREQAAQTLLDKMATEKQAASAEHQLAVLVTARAAALATAQQAVTGDNFQYQTMLGESDSLSARIIGLAAHLAKGKNPPQGTGHMDRPGRGVVTSPYGMRMHPILHYVKLHTGIDFAVADGISYAADDGVVLITEFNVAYGNMTVIDHGTVGGVHMTTLYAHQAAFGVRPGDHVVKGQPIGVIGETGYATGPHLHFEVRLNGGVVNPAPYLQNAPMPPLLKGSRAHLTAP
jgi:murein DD-endopeptidase MepM/ murein hydrolase activator NlpD